MPRRVRVKADAARVAHVQVMLLSHQTGERRNREIINTCGLSGDRGGHDEWGCGPRRARLDLDSELE